MPRPSRRALLVASGVLLVLVLSFVYLQRPKASPNSQNILTLSPPGFVRSAEAAGDQVASDLAAEAGISAYFQTAGNINLATIRDDYVTIEIETATYIIGSVDIVGYEDEYDAHVYAHESGWILAYYLKDDPVSKMSDPAGKTVDNTLLKEAVSTIASAAGQPFTDVSYYDFRYPNATHMMFIGEYSGDGDDNFTVNVPSSYGYFERSWANSTSHAYCFQLNGVTPIAQYSGANTYGYISAGDFPADTAHTFRLSCGNGGIVAIVYVVPE